MVCSVLAELFEEFSPGVPLGAVHGTSLCRPEGRPGTEAGTEAEAGSAREWPAGRSEWVAHCV
jgi:hypothetical protein